MTDTEIIIAVAKLDGWTLAQDNMTLVKQFSDRTRMIEHALVEKHLGHYLTSRDAIIPVIKKHINRFTAHSFIDALGIERSEDTIDRDGKIEYQGDGSYGEIWLLLTATPKQFCIALLKATK